MLPTENEEQSCMAGSSSSSTTTDVLAVAGIIFGCFGLLSAGYCAYVVSQLQKSQPLSAAGSSSSSGGDDQNKL